MKSTPSRTAGSQEYGRQYSSGQYSGMPVADVVVSGGGVVGCAAALALGRLGFQVVLLAPGTAPSSSLATSDDFDTRVYAINLAGRELLQRLQVWDALDVTRVTPVRTMQVRASKPVSAGSAQRQARTEADTTLELAGALPGLKSALPLNPFRALASVLKQREQDALLSFDAMDAHTEALAWIIEDSHLARALDGALRFTPSVRVVRQAFAGFAAEDSNTPDAGLRTLLLDNGEQLSARLLIGADGAQSQVRIAAGMDVAYKRYDQVATVANFSTEKPHHDIAWQWFMPGQGVIALLPLPGRRVSLVWSAPEALSQVLAQDAPGELACRVAALTRSPLGDLQPLSMKPPAQFPLSLMRVASPASHRVIVMGDAAHVVHPLAGHGLNMGFGDIAELVRLLDEGRPGQDCGRPGMIQAYARRRKEPVLLMQAVTDTLTRLFHPDGGPLYALAGSGMAVVENMPWLKNRLMTHALGIV